MSTVLRIAGCRFYFYSHETTEPPHVHVDHGASSAKSWLEPVRLARNLGFAAHELNELYRLVRTHRIVLLEAWHGYFGRRV